MATGFANAGKAEVTFRTGGLEQVLLTAANEIVAAKLDEMRGQVVQEVESIIRQEFVNDRSGRRRKERTQHLLGSIRAQVDKSGKTARLVIWSTADARKVGALEYGTSLSYIITPRDPDGFLFFPSNQAARPVSFGPNATRSTARRSVAYGSYNRKKGQGKKGELKTKTQIVQRDPWTGKHFMERGAKRVVRRVLQS